MVAGLTNRLIADVGTAILTYRPLATQLAFHRSLAQFRFMLGGNRSGKSESNIGFDLSAFALGVHPYRVTPAKATIWATAQTWDLVGKLLWQEKIRRYIPAHRIRKVVWHNLGADIPRELLLDNGVRIELKAFEQGRQAFAGRHIAACYADEQIETDSEAIWHEIQARLMDEGGFWAQSFTPLIYQKWLDRRLRSHLATDGVFYASLQDNRISRGGHIPDDQIDSVIANWPEEVVETRVHGRFGQFLGVVYKSFRRDIHVIEPCEVHGRLYRSIDWGYSNPFVCLWGVREGDTWTVVDEYYMAQQTLASHAEAIARKTGRRHVTATYADHDAQDAAEFAALGITTIPAAKAVRPGIEAVQTLLKVQRGVARLRIFSRCVHLIDELMGYHWRQGSNEERDPADEPAKVDDHCCDALRYMIYSADAGYFSAEETEG